MGALHCGVRVAIGQNLAPAARRRDQPLGPGQEHPDRGCQQPFVSEFTHNGKQRILTLGTLGVHRQYAFRQNARPRVVSSS